MSKRLASALLAAAASAALATSAAAEEGMWTFDNFPTAQVNRAYGARIDQAWLDRVRGAAVRIPGCSASNVSPDGLVLTNHHCVVGCIQDLSDPQNDYVKNGWFPRTRAEEKQCPGMTAEILTGITDVTPRVNRAAAGRTGAEFIKARDAETGRIEQETCGVDQTVRCQVVSLYRGGQYKLYKYRKYADVRLAFAPEFQAAFFGGDPDNFSFPRYALDAAFIRMYENGRPVSTPGHMRWNASAPKAGDLVFVAGNPGSTNRLQTVAQLETLRDLVIPHQQLTRSEMRGRLIRFSSESEENRRIATDPLFGNENSFKNFYGRMRSLALPAFFEGKRRSETEVQQRIAGRRAQITGDPWREIAEVQDDYAELYLPFYYTESNAGGGSQLYSWARQLVRSAQERAKPSAERLPEYSESRIPLVERAVLEARPTEAPLETMYLEWWLSKAREYLTADDPDTRLLLGRDSPESLSDRLVKGTRLADPAVRRQLWQGGLAAIQASNDPMIQYVLRTEGRGREVRAAWEQRVSGPTDRAAEQIAKARFLAYGDQVYPDATGTLRLTYGKIDGWTERGRTIAPFTYIKGLYERATGQFPFELAPRWAAARTRVEGDTVYDMVSTNDIIGGNSGSPLINARGEVIGAVFDGNLPSLGGAYGYDGSTNRTVTVSTAAITEALRNVYAQPALVAELTGGRQAAR